MSSMADMKRELKKKADADPDSFYPVKVLKEKGFLRNKCSKCGSYFWSINKRDRCGDPECGAEYTFIGKPIGRRLEFVECWKSFSSFFKKRGYSPIARYPVAARWRDDTDFVQASIYDFQPHVVSGAVKPPANPLVVPQYCLRFNEVENVGITGRHNTGFVMIGQHAFMPPEKFAQTLYFRDLFEWFVDEMRIPESEFTVVESQWGGGGNLGVSMEFFARGLEIGNQVYMMYKTTEAGYEPLSLKVLDMGMGQGRIAWLVNGSRTMYDAEYPDVCVNLFKKSGHRPTETFERFVPLGSIMDVDAGNSKQMDLIWKAISRQMRTDEKELRESVMPMAALYSIADHAQSLLFALGDGVLPSNVGGGYNLRAILRRSLGFIDDYGWDIDLKDVVKWHAKEWKKQYPELAESLDEVSTILEHEEKKYKETLDKSRRTVLALIKSTKDVDFKSMVKLYESEGITPELIKDVARKEKAEVSVPQDFYAKIAETHVTSAEQKREEEHDVSGLPPTKKLYYDDVYEFKAKVLREWSKNGKTYVVLDQTGFYPESGGQDYDNTICKVLQKTEPEADRKSLITRHSIRESKHRLRILLAEDNLVNQKLAVKVLERMGHSVSVAANGKRAIEALENGEFDLVLMDVQMPEMDGLEATRLIRESEKTTGSHVPIMAMTAYAMKEDEARCLEAGMDGYISKPIDAQALFETIENLFEAAGARDKPKPNSNKGGKILDRSAILDRLGGDTELLNEIASLFLEDCPKLLSEIRQAFQQGDEERLEKASHSLKGSVSNFGAGAAVEAALRVENMGRHRDLAEAPQAIVRLEIEIARVREELIALNKEVEP